MEFDRKLHTIQGAFELQLQEALKAQAETFSKSLDDALEQQKVAISRDAEESADIRVAQIRQETLSKLMEHQSNVSRVQTQLDNLNSVVEGRKDLRVLSGSLHKQSAALLALENALLSSKPLKTEIAALKAACKGDALFESVLSGISEESATKGIPTLPELRLRFKVVRNEVRKVALAPEAAPKLIGQMIGNALAAVSVAPKGYVDGEGLEESLARTSFLLDQDDLKGALKELEGLQGYSQKLLSDWEKAASSRLNADEAVKVMRAGSAARHMAIANK